MDPADRPRRQDVWRCLASVAARHADGLICGPGWPHDDDDEQDGTASPPSAPPATPPQGPRLSTCPAPEVWLAPLSKERWHRTRATDAWACRCLLFELFSGAQAIPATANTPAEAFTVLCALLGRPQRDELPYISDAVYALDIKPVLDAGAATRGRVGESRGGRRRWGRARRFSFSLSTCAPRRSEPTAPPLTPLPLPASPGLPPLSSPRGTCRRKPARHHAQGE